MVYPKSHKKSCRIVQADLTKSGDNRDLTDPVKTVFRRKGGEDGRVWVFDAELGNFLGEA